MIGGSGSIRGEQRTWTEYKYETAFFIREPDGRDNPIRIVGEHLPLLDGHQVSAAVVANDWDEALLVAIVNQSTGRIHWVTTERKFVRFIGIARRRRVRVELMTPEERAEEVNERSERLRRYAPVWQGAVLVGGAAALLGFVLLMAKAAFGGILLVLGLCAALAGGGVWLIYYQQLRAARNQPLTETTSVRNREIDDEIDALCRFVEGLLEA
jgi:hypothetical protein